MRCSDHRDPIGLDVGEGLGAASQRAEQQRAAHGIPVNWLPETVVAFDRRAIRADDEIPEPLGTKRRQVAGRAKLG